jgi:oligopeptide transport system substrate-binding protein
MIRKTRAAATLLILVAAAAVVWQYSVEPVAQGPASSVLHRGLLTDPETVDPQRVRSTQAGDILRDIGEGLLSYSATGDLVPGAADEWSLSADGLVYTFHIREGARWSNGEPLTAEHFAFSLRRLVDPATAAFYSQMVGDIVNAREIIAGDVPASELGVEAVDDNTLVIRLERPVPYLLSLLTYPSTFPVHPDSIALHGDEFTRPGNLLSNGAYKLDKTRRSMRFGTTS